MSPEMQVVITVSEYFAAGFILLAACTYLYNRYSRK